MPVIRLETVIRAPRMTCFDLARSVGAHLGSTADTGERVVSGRRSGLLELGEEITWEARHLGVRQQLTARITRLEARSAWAARRQRCSRVCQRRRMNRSSRC